MPFTELMLTYDQLDSKECKNWKNNPLKKISAEVLSAKCQNVRIVSDMDDLVQDCSTGVTAVLC